MNMFKFLVVASLLFSANVAWAQSEPTVDDVQCGQDADCPDGFACVMDEAECPPCREGGDCPTCGVPFSYCQPPPPAQCSGDADCSTGEVCVSYTFESCSGSVGAACGPDEDCDTSEPDPVSCTSETEAYCVPRFVAPCAEAADCGGGFTCEDVEICSCSSGGAVPVDPDGTTSSDDEPSGNCECSPSGDKYCHLVEVECATDSECATDLTCQDVGGDVLVVEVCADGETCDTSDPTPQPMLRCAPSGYDTWGGGGADRVANATNAEGAVDAGERVSWGESGSKASTDDGCSTTGTSSTLLPVFLLLGFFGLRRRKD